MKFANAYQGVKKIFTAEILSLIGAVCLIIFAALGVVAIAAVAAMGGSAEDVAVVSGIGAGIFGLAGGILSLIALILTLVGTKRASNDEPAFGHAFSFIICALILTLASTILSSIWATGIWDNACTTVASIFSLFAIIYIIHGVQNLAEQLSRPDMVAKGNTYLKLLIAFYVIQIIVRLIQLGYPRHFDFGFYGILSEPLDKHFHSISNRHCQSRGAGQSDGRRDAQDQ